MNISKNKVVKIHYRLSNEQGEVLESSFDAKPMEYLHGAQNLIPGLETALEGKAIDDTIDVTIAAEEAYGEYNPNLCQEVPLSAFGDVQDIVPGMRFIAETQMGQRPVQVTEVKDDTVVVDGNHPLAGKPLTFHVQVVELRDATEEEMANGDLHQHGCGSKGGCCGGDEKSEGQCCKDKEEESEGCGKHGGCGCH